jgi:hypothetical protein
MGIEMCVCIRPAAGPAAAGSEAAALTRSHSVTPLVSITFGPYVDTSVDMLVAQHNTFVQELFLTEDAVTRNLTQETQTFTKDERDRKSDLQGFRWLVRY